MLRYRCGLDVGVAEHQLNGANVDAVETLNQNREWPVFTEYRAMLGGLFKRMYSLDASRLDRVFPRTVSLDLGLV
jgi:hypothetical protein